MSGKDYYQILGVTREASDQEIKRAYRKLAKKYHPDTNPGNKEAEKKFQEVNEAYGILGDGEKRKIYDTYGSAAFDGTGNTGGAYQGNPFGQGGPFSGFTGQDGAFHETGGSWTDGNGTYHTFHFDGNDPHMKGMFGDLFGDLFGEGSGDFRNFDGSGFGSGSRNSSGPGRQNADARADIDVSFDEALNGADKVIRVRGADGRVRNLKVHIPAGIEDGKSIRLKGKGSKISNGSAGDLYLKIHVGDKKGWSRKGADLYMDFEVPFTTAVFGGQAIVPTSTGRIALKIPAGCQSGTKIRVRGKGAQRMQDPSAKGDLYVVVRIGVPTDLTPSERKKLKEFQQLYEDNRNAGSKGRSA